MSKWISKSYFFVILFFTFVCFSLTQTEEEQPIPGQETKYKLAEVPRIKLPLEDDRITLTFSEEFDASKVPTKVGLCEFDQGSVSDDSIFDLTMIESTKFNFTLPKDKGIEGAYKLVLYFGDDEPVF